MVTVGGLTLVGRPLRFSEKNTVLGAGRGFWGTYSLLGILYDMDLLCLRYIWVHT